MGECWCGKCDDCLQLSRSIDRADECRIEEMRLENGDS